uniref:Uncharacterized protein n=1 Tax=Physcomitrium patens TaxID=3218 RepID=A0A2K1LAD0_PHYPA|nr:hypothetical protein PHYPA_001403 [Physcomitrium patens]
MSCVHLPTIHSRATMNPFWHSESCVLDVAVVNVIKTILLTWPNLTITYLHYRNFFTLSLFLGVERRKGW